MLTGFPHCAHPFPALCSSVYVCDGTPRTAGTVADWFAGPVENGLLTAASSQHHLRLAARLGSQDAAGTLTLPSGQTASFTIAARPAARREGGIFAGTAHWRGRSYQAGWIVLPDGQQRGAAFYRSSSGKGLMIAVSDFPTGPV